MLHLLSAYRLGEERDRLATPCGSPGRSSTANARRLRRWPRVMPAAPGRALEFKRKPAMPRIIRYWWRTGSRSSCLGKPGQKATAYFRWRAGNEKMASSRTSKLNLPFFGGRLYQPRVPIGLHFPRRNYPYCSYKKHSTSSLGSQCRPQTIASPSMMHELTGTAAIASATSGNLCARSWPFRVSSRTLS